MTNAIGSRGVSILDYKLNTILIIDSIDMKDFDILIIGLFGVVMV